MTAAATPTSTTFPPRATRPPARSASTFLVGGVAGWLFIWHIFTGG